MLKGFVTFLVCTSLCACAGAPVAYYASDIQVVTQDQLNDFWQAGGDAVSFRASPGFQPSPGCGHVFVQYLIDSNGAVFNPEIIESEPAGVYDRTALKYLGLVRYIPAETNPGRIPVKTTQKTTFTTKGQACES